MSKETKLINPDRLISPARYSKKVGLSPSAITKQKKEGRIETVEFDGGWLVYLPEKEK